MAAGLWLRVTSAGAKSWILRYWVAERDPATGRLIRDPKPRGPAASRARMKDAKVVKAIAFFDNRDFDEFWNRVSPKP